MKYLLKFELKSKLIFEWCLKIPAKKLKNDVCQKKKYNKYSVIFIKKRNKKT